MKPKIAHRFGATRGSRPASSSCDLWSHRAEHGRGPSLGQRVRRRLAPRVGCGGSPVAGLRR